MPNPCASVSFETAGGIFGTQSGARITLLRAVAVLLLLWKLSSDARVALPRAVATFVLFSLMSLPKGGALKKEIFLVIVG
jgi:hypothetical protein